MTSKQAVNKLMPFIVIMFGVMMSICVLLKETDYILALGFVFNALMIAWSKK